MQVDVADTVGCGDSFTAAAALGWLAAAELRTLLTLCNAVGAATATSVGAGRQVRSLLSCMRSADNGHSLAGREQEPSSGLVSRLWEGHTCRALSGTGRGSQQHRSVPEVFGAGELSHAKHLHNSVVRPPL